MNLSALSSDSAVLEELGRRITQVRLHRNLTQGALASAAGLSKRTVERVETGRSIQLANLIRLFRVLDIVQNLDQLIAIPMEQLNPGGKPRQRASRTSSGRS